MNTNILEQDIQKSKHMIEHTTSKSKKAYYMKIAVTLSSILNEINQKQTIIGAPQKNWRFMNKQLENWTLDSIKDIKNPEYIKMINTMTKNAKKYLKKFELFEHFKKELTLKQGIDLIIEFFTQYDKNVLPIVNKCLNEENLFLINKYEHNGCGYAYFNNFSNNPYIVIYTNNNKLSILNIICLVHEIGHVINFYTSANGTKIYNKITFSNFREVPSYIYEQLFIEYLLKKQIHTTNVHKTINNNLYDLSCWIEHLRITNFIIEDFPMETEEVDIDIIKDLLLEKGYYYEDDKYIYECFDDITSNYTYTYGMLLALYYNELHKKDPEKTKKDMDNFISCIGIMDDFDMLNNFGINLNEFISCNYLKNIVKENQKVLKIDSK